MLISYALLIFVLTSSVVAPPPPPAHQPEQASDSQSDSEWQVLKGNKDKRLMDTADPSHVWRWYKVRTLKTTADLISWPEDKGLDLAVQFKATDDDGVQQVSSYRIYRQIHQNEVANKYEYPFIRYTMRVPKALDETDIPLEGFWARADMFAAVSDDFWKS